MRLKSRFLLASLALFLFPFVANAQEFPSEVSLKTDFNIWDVRVARQDWLADYSKQSWLGLPIQFDPSDSMAIPHLETETVRGVNRSAIRDYLNLVVAPELNRERQDVTIDLTDEGTPVFDGFAIDGQSLNVPLSVFLIKFALDQGEENVRMALNHEPAQVTVLSDELRDKGVVELIATGETDFAGSPYNRRHNIDVGLHSFTGRLFAPGQQGSVVDMLGRIDASTGYLPELVIKGDKTIPEYGGGLCQVSSTLYRGLLFAGVPITERRNHSYSVSYYDPQGLDATIYPGSADLKFVNDTDHHILIQTTTIGDKAYANVYGTKLDRTVDLVGPYYYAYQSVPSPRVEYSTNLAPGEKQVVGGAHVGFQASWYRRINYESQNDVIEHIYSKYQARPNYTIIGISPESDSANSEPGL